MLTSVFADGQDGNGLQLEKFIEWNKLWTAEIEMKWRCDHRSCIPIEAITK